MALLFFRSSFHRIKSKTGRMTIMLILTVAIAVTEIIYGFRSRSQLLIADGLFSLAEGIALVGSLIALRYAKATRLHSKNTFGWARLEILAGLLQEVLLISLSLSILVDAVNKLINPNHIEDASAMIFLGSAGVFIGLLGLVLFRGYHHDHNIGHEIVEHKKNEFVRSVYTTLQRLDLNPEMSINEARNQIINVPELIVTETNSNSLNETRKKRQFQQDLILPSLNDTYRNAFIVSDRSEQIKLENISVSSEQQLRVPNLSSLELSRSRSRSGDSIGSSTFGLNQELDEVDDEIQESRVFATLHALCLHSLAVLLESSVVLISGLLNKFVPNKDKDGNPKNVWLKYIDPSLTILMVVIVTVKAIPVIWSLGHILVEAVPSGINTRQLIKTIMKEMPQIRAVHSVYVWRATARDVFATLHVVCDEDLSIGNCAELFGREFRRIFATHCIRHFTLQYEYVEPGGNFHRCTYGIRRRQRGHQSNSEDTDKLIVDQNISIDEKSIKRKLVDPPRQSV